MSEGGVKRLRKDPLVMALKDPLALRDLQPSMWTAFIRRARAGVLLPKIASLASEAAVASELPSTVQRLFHEAGILFEENQRMLRWEERRVAGALAPLDVRPILLKGGAYILGELTAGKGRLSSDLDILVPRDKLDSVETALIDAGWQSMKSNDYDDRYYRRWMHELPPLQHKDRRTLVDVHHNILPPTGRLHPLAEPLLAAAVALPGGRSLRLADTDLILHSAAHLAEDGDFRNRLRDLYDIHELLGEFGLRERFWEELMDRADELGLWRPLAHSAQLSAEIFETELPDAFRQRAEAKLSHPARWIIGGLASRIMVPPHDRAPVRGRNMAVRILYMRSHWLRMPPLLLARHLATKFIRRMIPTAG